MRAWGVVVVLSLSVATACGSATAAAPRTTPVPPGPATTSASAATVGDPVTTGCGSLLTDARLATAAVLSYDYRDLPASLAAIKPLTTPAEYAREAATRTNVVAPLAVQNHAVLTGVSLGSAYVDGGCTQPRVLAFSQTTSTSAVAARTVAVQQLLLTFDPIGGHYLLAATGTASGGLGAGATAPECPTAAVAAARTAASSASYDYRALATQLPAIAADLTGEALTQFQEQEADLRASVTSSRTVARATVLATGYAGGGCASPTLLVVMTVSYTTASGSAAPQTQLVRIQLEPHGAGWQASELTPVTAAS